MRLDGTNERDVWLLVDRRHAEGHELSIVYDVVTADRLDQGMQVIPGAYIVKCSCGWDTDFLPLVEAREAFDLHLVER